MSDSDSLLSILRRRIADHGGFLRFDAFMQAALYEPGLGYYESQPVFGEQGDFVTGADLGPWLRLGFADLVRSAWEGLGRPSDWVLIEQGGGSGRLLAGLMRQLQDDRLPLPSRVIEVERSRRLRGIQSQCFAKAGLEIEHAKDLASLAPMENVVCISNELPDAFPVRVFCYRDGVFHELGVGDEDGLVWLEAGDAIEDPPSIDAGIVAQWPDGYVSEWNPGLDAWQRDLARIVLRGYVLTVDYGFSQREYYRPGRERGTLLAHHRHRAHEDVLAHPGEQDLTAHVDFTALVRAGLRYGLTPLVWMPQGAWLGQSPSVQAHVAHLARSMDAAAMTEMAQARRMLMPTGMGEHFRLLVQASGEALGCPAVLSTLNRMADLGLGNRA